MGLIVSILAPGDFYSKTSSARKIIVVDLGYLGDTVHLIPALWELKRNYPSARLHAVTSPVGAEVLRLVKCVDRIWPVERRRGKRSLSEQLRMVCAWRKEKYDIAFHFNGGDRSLYLTGLSGARWRVGHRGARWHFYNPLLIQHWVPRQDPDLLVWEQRRQVLAACGLKLGQTRFNLNIDSASKQFAEELVPEFAIHLSPNSSKPTREWPLQHHAAMLRSVWRALPELRVLVSAADQPREQQRLQALAERVQDSRLQVLPTGLTISQLAAVLTRCKLHVGPDSGVLHLAVVLNVPTVSFFREQGAYKSFMPSGPLHRVISMACHCIDGCNAPCERTGQAECFERIAPGLVARIVQEQLATVLTSASSAVAA